MKLTSDEAGRRAEALAASSSDKQMSSVLATKLAHAGIQNIPNAPMAPPIHVATTYTRPADGNYNDSDSKYSRYDNPTRVLLEKTVFELETIGLDEELIANHEPSTSAFASGMMAATAVILAHTTPLTVILPHDLYHGVTTLMVDVFSRHNVTVQRADMTSVEATLNAIADARPDSEVIVWMESPSNPMCHVIDIEAICDKIRDTSSHTVTTVVDVTMASPVVTRPLELGADIALHSGTKYMAGHSDALLGLLTLSPISKRGKELSQTMKAVQVMTGGVASSWDAWLTLRGLRTLQIRVERQSKTAMALTKHLSTHELVEAVHYPGLTSHPQHEVAKRQMAKFGGVFSLELEDEVMATAFAAALTILQRATSLGGTETLIEHRASIEPPERRTSPPGLLRVSVGLEDEDDLLRDIETALSIAYSVVSDGR